VEGGRVACVDDTLGDVDEMVAAAAEGEGVDEAADLEGEVQERWGLRRLRGSGGDGG